MEDFTPDDAWAITRLIQLSNFNKRRRQQIDQQTKQKMLTQWDWWRTNYLDASNTKKPSLGPTRKLLETIYADDLIQRNEDADRVATARRHQIQNLNRFKVESKRSHQLALTNAATATRMLEAENPSNLLISEMARMTNGAVASRASVNERPKSLRSSVRSLSILDFVPPGSRAQKLPRSPSPYFERDIAASKNSRRDVRMLYFDGQKRVPLNFERAAISLPVTAMSSYTPDLDSLSVRSVPIKMNDLTHNFPVIAPKCISTLWRNPANHDTP